MKIILFYHSLLSDWNHGNAHFLRGICTELLSRGHEVQVFEPAGGWSYTQWRQEKGEQGLQEFQSVYPALHTHFYAQPADIIPALQDADLVIVHEWNEPDIVSLIGRQKAGAHFKLLFHDTHHRSVTAAAQMQQYDLSAYDGVLAYGKVIKDHYLRNCWTARAWTWHEAADTRIFKPRESIHKDGDLVWVGNWGDEERTEELIEFLIEPVKQLGIRATMFGVRYPPEALQRLKEAGISYGGYLPSYQVPEIFAHYTFTIHVPRRPYTKALPGIPTIRPFEAMACGIPLISAPWHDSEHLFREGTDYLIAQDGAAMTASIQHLLQHPDKAADLVRHGLETIQDRHTCRHRVDELLQIYNSLSENEETVSENKTFARI